MQLLYEDDPVFDLSISDEDFNKLGNKMSGVKGVLASLNHCGSKMPSLYIGSVRVGAHEERRRGEPWCVIDCSLKVLIMYKCKWVHAL